MLRLWPMAQAVRAKRFAALDPTPWSVRGGLVEATWASWTLSVRWAGWAEGRSPHEWMQTRALGGGPVARVRAEVALERVNDL